MEIQKLNTSNASIDALGRSSVKDACGENSANKTLPGVSETWRHVVAMRNSTQCFFINCASKTIVLFRNEIWLCKIQTFIIVFTTIYWVKPTWPTEPILLTSILLMGALPGDAG